MGSLLPEDEQEGWTHVLQSAVPPAAHVLNSLNLLSSILTLPVHDPLRVTVALDFYKIPPDADHPGWRNTEIGELINRGKYQGRYDESCRKRAGKVLADRISATIRAHPILTSATTVIDVPGHDKKQVSFGSQLAQSVAHRVSVPFIRTHARDEFRPPAKAGLDEARAAVIKDSFAAGADLTGHIVLIVDDVLRSGLSMSETAQAAVRARASMVMGIAAGRTLRR